MNPSRELPGLERLIAVCQQRALGLKTMPPGQRPVKAGTLVEGLPFDPVLSAVYARVGYAAFATDVPASIILTRYDDAEKKVEEDNRWWSGHNRDRLALPTFVFAGEPMLAYHYATVPDLANAQGCQPVVHVDVYEEPYALPVASNVDLFFDAYARYLEALLTLPTGRERGTSVLTFPWDVPEIIARDDRLVNLIQAGSFDQLMPSIEEQRWAQKVITTRGSLM